MLFSNGKKDEVILILDVQSSLVRAALILEETGKKPYVLFIHNDAIPFQENSDSTLLIKATIEAVSRSIDEILRYLHTVGRANGPTLEGSRQIPWKISAVHYVLSSPWILSEAKRIAVQFPQQKIITNGMVFEMVRNEREKLAADVDAKNKVTVVEEKIFNVELNGYPISNWHGKSAISLDVSFVTSISGIRTVDRFKDICRHVVRAHNIHFHSSLLLQHIGLSQIFPERESYAIVHVHSEITDVVLVDKRSCIFFGTYPFGTKSILRAVAGESGTDLRTADSSINLQSSGIIDKKLDMNSSIVNKQYESWVDQLLKTVARAPIQFGPQLPIVVSAPERQNDFEQILKQKIPRSKVEALKIEEIITHATFDTTVDRLLMVGLYAIALGTLRPK